MLRMPRFFFHIRYGNELTIDSDGEEFTSLAAARMKALALSSHIIVEDLKRFGDVRQRYIEVANETQEILLIIPLIAE